MELHLAVLLSWWQHNLHHGGYVVCKSKYMSSTFYMFFKAGKAHKYYLLNVQIYYYSHRSWWHHFQNNGNNTSANCVGVDVHVLAGRCSWGTGLRVFFMSCNSLLVHMNNNLRNVWVQTHVNMLFLVMPSKCFNLWALLVEYSWKSALLLLF